jgi:alanine racemase
MQPCREPQDLKNVRAQPRAPFYMTRFPSKSHPRIWVEIDTAALAQNATVMREHLGGRTGLIGVVKANAYGHGIAQVVPALISHVEMFAVANVAEAHEVAALAPEKKILLLGPAAPHERAEALASGFIPMVSSTAEAAAYSQLSRSGKSPVHLKLDTGMGRMGLWHEEAITAVREMRSLHGIAITGLATHLPVADENAPFTRAQLELFYKVANVLREEEGLAKAQIHVCNSAGAIRFPEVAGDLARVGLALYGASPVPEFQSRLLPAMTWKAMVTLVRDLPAGCGVSYGRTFITPCSMRVATLAAGYADGYQRHLSNQHADVVIRGERCRVLGRVTMDQIVVDVSALEECEAGDEAILLGAEIPAGELASKAGTIPWEIFTGIGSRVLRKQTTAPA